MEEEREVNITGPDFDKLVDALCFYANPENYHAIAFLADPPAGCFMDDFGPQAEHGWDSYARDMPGKRAREALRTIGYSVPAPDDEAT